MRFICILYTCISTIYQNTPWRGIQNFKFRQVYFQFIVMRDFNLKTRVPLRPLICFCLFVCLFVWGLSSHSRIFHSYRDVTITSEELQMLTYARPSWPLTSEGSLKCRTYHDMGHPFRMVNSRIVEHLAVGLFLRLEFVAAKILTSNLPHARVTL